MRHPQGEGIAIEQPDYSAEYQRSWALVVGIDQYEDPNLPPLSTGVKGARAVANTLRDDLGFDPERIILLENEEATQRAIRRAFVDPLGREEKVGPDDRVVVYFGGHGLTYDTAEGEIGCIAPYDIERAYWDTAIPMDELTRLANRIHAKHVLFVLDACFSGFATTREISPGVRRQVGDYLRRPARQVISAGTRDQLAADMWGPGGHALFTGFLLEGLRGAAPTPGGVLRAFHLAGYLQDEVATHSHSLQTPQYAALIGSRGGDFVFSVRDVVELPPWLVAASESDNSTQRLVAVSELRALARGDDPDIADQALARLHEMAESDPDALVLSSAQTVLRELLPGTTVAPVEREETIVAELPPEPEPAVETPVAELPPEPEPAVETPVAVETPSPTPDALLDIIKPYAEGAETFFVYPDIPPRMLKNGRRTSKAPPDEQILALLDSSLWSNGRVGLLFGTEGIYYFNDWAGLVPGKGSVPYDEFPEREFRTGLPESDESTAEVYLGNDQYYCAAGALLTPEKIVALLNAIKDLVAASQS
jgi:hypothetical protein